MSTSASVMADRVHPSDSTLPETSDRNQEPIRPKPNDSNLEADSFPPRPNSSTYVIQVPKDQIYRIPPPENADLFKSYSRNLSRRCSSPLCRCLLWTLCIVLALILLIIITSAILYFVLQPKVPAYTLDRLAIKGFDGFTSSTSSPTFSPEFDVTVRADNPNQKIGVYYKDGSDIRVSYQGLDLCHGSWPVFYQGTRNVTVFQAVLVGSGVRMTTALWSEMVDQERRGQVPLEIGVRVPVRVKSGVVTSWTVMVEVRCDVVMDKMTADSRIVSKNCRTKVHM